MNDTPDTSIIARFLGQNWRTTIGGAMAAAGGVLAASAPAGSRWQIAGQVIGAVGVAWLGIASRDRVVSSDQMQAAKDAKEAGPFVVKQFPVIPEITAKEDKDGAK